MGIGFVKIKISANVVSGGYMYFQNVLLKMRRVKLKNIFEKSRSGVWNNGYEDN